ncbi:MAG: hypothetical protein LBE25_09240 [Arthrobacter sp.]|jgi:hypothetical protein|nr:hypothetical protein [Arthrobacter sp.]
MKNRQSARGWFTTGTPWHPAPEVPGTERAERLRLEMETQLWTVRSYR